MAAHIISLHIGRPRSFQLEGSTVKSSFERKSVEGSVPLLASGFEGDEVADKKAHGGPDKAVCVYPHEHYRHWKRRLGTLLEPPAFGENLTTRGLKESSVCIGDIYRVGGALVQVTQPRAVCKKPGAKHGEPRLTRWMIKTGFTGFYAACIEPGLVAGGDPIELVERGSGGFTVEEANRLMYRDRRDREAIRALLEVDALSDDWRYSLLQRL